MLKIVLMLLTFTSPIFAAVNDAGIIDEAIKRDRFRPSQELKKIQADEVQFQARLAELDSQIFSLVVQLVDARARLDHYESLPISTRDALAMAVKAEVLAYESQILTLRIQKQKLEGEHL